MMISSRDRTSTVGRMWLLGDVTSSEEGEAEPGVRGQGAPSTKKQEEGSKASRVYCMHMLHMLGCIHVIKPWEYCII